MRPVSIGSIALPLATCWCLAAFAQSPSGASPAVAPAPSTGPVQQQQSAPVGQAAPARPAQALAKMPWFTRLGMRAIDVEIKLPVRDQVVLVPDEAAFIAEIARWTPTERWPVLIEDTAFAPRFIRAFKPSVVIRRAPAAEPGVAVADPSAVKSAVDGALARAWGGDPAAGGVAALRAIGLVPAGLVVASASDPAWVAALALAAGRGQPIVWLDQPLGGSADDVLDAARFTAFDAAVRAAFETSGLSWTGLGDDLDALTVCRSAAGRVALASPPGGRHPQLPPDAGPFALTDALCRHPDGSRYAFAGHVFGERVRAAYIAMSSLFLRRNDVWEFDGYAGRAAAGGFAQFSFERATAVFEEQGFRTRVWAGDDAGPTAWRSMLPKGIDADVMLVNSSGNADFFELAQSQQLPSTDVPVLRRPLALSMVHSFSLQVPDSPWSVGGRWLAHGAYAYVGSVHEPFLMAFVPPALVAERLAALAPFLVAGRQWPGDFLPQVWRVATIGDPLMTVPPPKTVAMLPGRIAAAEVEPAEDVRAAARAALERMKSATAAADVASAAADAMRALVLTGDDRVAAQLLDLCRSRGAGEAVAPLALGSIFRAGTRAQFMQAWPLVKSPSDEERDMLWQLWSVDLAALADPATVKALKAAVRGPKLHQDAQALLPGVRNTEGGVAAMEWLNSLIQRATDAEVKRRLAQLQG